MLPIPAIITIGFIIVATVGLIVWDIVVAVNDVPNRIDTISGRMKAWGKKTLLLPWLWAMLYGHFWGVAKPGQFLPIKTTIPILVALTISVVIFSIFLTKNGISINKSWIVFFAILNLGALAGAILWPQS